MDGARETRFQVAFLHEEHPVGTAQAKGSVRVAERRGRVGLEVVGMRHNPYSSYGSRMTVNSPWSYNWGLHSYFSRSAWFGRSRQEAYPYSRCFGRGGYMSTWSGRLP